MTIGKKIYMLRTAKGISQEQLAELTEVSRQSVSKWEMDAALPQIDKVLQLCQLFGVSADQLLREDVSIETPAPQKSGNKYFGTDGFRGEAGVVLTSMHAYKIGRFLGWYYAKNHSGSDRARIVIGKDTRRSSYMLEYSIVAGITASGADAYMLHVTTTPSISYVTRMDGFDCGIMITASHNPFYDNGIKVINRYGEKLDDNATALIEAYIDGDLETLGVKEPDLPLAQRERVGCIVDHVAGRNRYVAYLISLASNSYKKLRIGIDCANGASWMIAKAVFGALGAQLTVIGDEPDGLNINTDCGSMHIENLCKKVREEHLDMGFALDGDGDRCIAVDDQGNVVDGDAILYILGNRLKARGMLTGNTLVATIMSNSGLFAALKKAGIECAQTTVGDRFVYECMQNNDYALGGEQSGHIILKKYATTGDGLLTAIMLAEEVCDSKTPLSKLHEAVRPFPQVTQNVRVKDKDAVLSDPAVTAELEAVRALIGENGRALLRKSGTEPVIRVMIESESEQRCADYADRLVRAIRKGGHAVE